MSGLGRILALVAACAALAGCATVPEDDASSIAGARADGVVLAPNMDGIEILSLREAVATDGTRRMNVTARSTSDFRQTLRYRALWFDANGLEMRTSLSNWNRRVIEARQTFEATVVAPGPAARSFRIEFEKSPN